MKKQIGLFAAILFAVSTLMVGCKAEVHTHTFAEEWSSDKTTHWHAATCGCSDVELQKTEHTFGNWTTTKEATEEAEGSKERPCTVCGYTATEAIEKLAHTHKFATEWTKDETNHWHASTCGHEVTEGKTAHTFGDWTTTKEASCTENGERKTTCTICGYEKTAGTDKAEHTFGEYVSNNDATTETDGTKTRECSVCGYEDTVTDEGSKIIVPEMVFVKGATVTGALPAWLDESASNFIDAGIFIEGRTVTLSDFYMGKYEVTQEEYASVMAGQKVIVNGTEYALESNPSYCTKDSTSYTLFNGDVQEKRPVEGVTWYDAVWYCNALSEKEGLTKAYNIEVIQVEQASGKTGYYISSATVSLVENANGYRLPIEGEWEYAARGGDPTKDDWNYMFSGADTAEDVSYDSLKNAGLDSVGWYCYNNITGITGDSDVTEDVSGKGTHQVGKKAPNRLGLYDMSGNVKEWGYHMWGVPGNRVCRGGSWGGRAVSVCLRASSNAHGRSYNVGFRVVRQAN